jgi:hypothetical protein
VLAVLLGGTDRYENHVVVLEVLLDFWASELEKS